MRAMPFAEVPLSQSQVRQLRRYFRAVRAAESWPHQAALVGQVWRFDAYRNKDRRPGPLLRVAFLDPGRALEVQRAINTPMIPWGYGIPAPGKEGP